MTRPSVDPGDLIEYVLAHSTPPDEVQRALVTATEEVAGDASVMRIGHDQAVFMALLTAAIAPRLAVEVGTFTGYSALAIARALPEGARLLCCDVSEEWTAVARSHWERAGVAHRIDLRIGPAIDTLRALPGGHEVDLAFIDADKTGYQDYYDELLPRLSDRGVMLVDNTLWSGRVLDDTADDADSAAIRAFNDEVAADPRSEAVLLTIGDGITMIRRRTGEGASAEAT